MTTQPNAFGDRARWNALSHRLAGEVAALEWQLNLVLALDTGRDRWTVLRALELIQRLPIEGRARLLDQLDPNPHDGLSQTTASWIRELSKVRNQLAHSWIVDASKQSASFQSFYRGSSKTFTLTDRVMASHIRKAIRARRNLVWLETLVGDPMVWAQLMGFDER